MPRKTRGQHIILHVDDDPQFSRIVERRIRKLGAEFIAISNPFEAINQIVAKNVRLVLLDIDMPGKDGISLLKEIKAHDSTIQVIMLTGLVTMGTVLSSYRQGAEACLFKPLTAIQPLIEALEDSFRKLDRWWDSLHALSQQRKIETSLATSL